MSLQVTVSDNDIGTISPHDSKGDNDIKDVVVRKTGHAVACPYNDLFHDNGFWARQERHLSLFF